MAYMILFCENLWRYVKMPHAEKSNPKNLLGVILPTESIRKMGVCEVCHNLEHDCNVDHPEWWSSLWIAMLLPVGIPTLPPNGCFYGIYRDFMWNLVLGEGLRCFLCSWKKDSPHFLHGTVSLMARCSQVTFLWFQPRRSPQALHGSSWAPKLPFPWRAGCETAPYPGAPSSFWTPVAWVFPLFSAGEARELRLCVGRGGAGVRGHQRRGVLLLHGRQHCRGQGIRHRPAARQPLPRRLLTKVSLWSRRGSS